MAKRVLVIAKNNQPEALRVAAGLTLLNHQVKVAVLGAIEDSAAVREQQEILEFAEVPCETLGQGAAALERLARGIFEAEAVYLL
jgi:hypothetical protein